MALLELIAALNRIFSLMQKARVTVLSHPYFPDVVGLSRAVLRRHASRRPALEGAAFVRNGEAGEQGSAAMEGCEGGGPAHSSDGGSTAGVAAAVK